MNRLRECRKNKNLTLRQLSKELGEKGFKISADALGKYERGDREPKLEAWIKLADFYSVPVSYIQGLSDHNYNDPQLNIKMFLERNPSLSKKIKNDNTVNIITVSDLKLQIRDLALKQFQGLAQLFLNEKKLEITYTQKKKLIQKADSLNDADINEIDHYVSIFFYMLLSDSGDESIIQAKRCVDDFWDRYIRRDDNS